MNRIQQLQLFLKEYPNDPFPHFALALEHLKGANDDQALFHFEYLIKNHSDYIGTYYHLGKLQEKLDQKEAALQIYATGMEKSKAQEDFHSLRELQGAFMALKDDLT